MFERHRRIAMVVKTENGASYFDLQHATEHIESVDILLQDAGIALPDRDGHYTVVASFWEQQESDTPESRGEYHAGSSYASVTASTDAEIAGSLPGLEPICISCGLPNPADPCVDCEAVIAAMEANVQQQYDELERLSEASMSLQEIRERTNAARQEYRERFWNGDMDVHILEPLPVDEIENLLQPKRGLPATKAWQGPPPRSSRKRGR